MKRVLAFDMGATSIRGIIGYVKDGKLVTEEVMRMAHSIKNKNGRLYWDFDAILEKIVSTIIENKDVSCIGIDTWGVDFGVIDKDGKLIDTPFSYRDEKYAIGREEAKAKISELEIFKNSGNQIMTINTIFQLLTLKKLNPDIYEKADKMLMMPDLIFYMLTGKKIGEETIWSTTGLYDMGQRKVSDTIFEKLELKKSLVPEIVKATEVVGNTKDSGIEALRGLSIDVKAWEEGYKIAIGIKKSSQENKIMYHLRSLYYKTIKKLSEVEQIEHFTGFGLYDKAFINVMRNLDDPVPFLRGIVAELGFRRKEIPYEQPQRRAGITSNNLYRLYDAAMLSVTAYTKVGLRLATFAGVILSGISMIIAIIYLILKLLYWDRFPAGMAPILIGMLFLGSIQIFFIGLIGEYILTINQRVMKRPLVVEEERLNFDE